MVSMTTTRLGPIDSICGTKESTPFIIWQHEVQMAVIHLGFTGDDVRAASGKLQPWWNAGESISMAAYGLRTMVEGLLRARRVDSDTDGLRRVIHNGRLKGRQNG